MGEFSLSTAVIWKRTNRHPLMVSRSLSHQSKPGIGTCFIRLPEQPTPLLPRALLLLVPVSERLAIPSPRRSPSGGFTPRAPLPLKAFGAQLPPRSLRLCSCTAWCWPVSFLSSHLHKHSGRVRILLRFAHRDYPAPSTAPRTQQVLWDV